VIVRPRPSLIHILFAIRGSILPRIWRRLAFLALLSLAAIALAGRRPEWLAGLAAMPFTLIGLSLSIFMSFRNTACYDRWWEGRKLWGQLVIASRSVARQTVRLDPADRAPVLIGLCGFTAGLAARLRGTGEEAAIAPHAAAAGIPDEEWRDLPNPADAMLRAVGARCIDLAATDRITPIHHSVIEAQLTELGHVQGGCERIKFTPLPFAYSLLLHRTAYLFCGLLPFALAPTLGGWAMLPTLMVGYAFFGLDALGDEMGDPFGADPNDLPLDALVRTVERDLLAAAGRDDLPPPLVARDFILT
jgi:putative membrane protein